MKELILGGARSGKSALAATRARESGKPVTYIATATPGDAEMLARIATHRAQRPSHWTLVEEPIALAATLRRHAAAQRCVLVDCLTLWLTNLLPEGGAVGPRSLFERERDALLETLPELPGHVILVSNEVGWGVVPLGALTRRFVDEAGFLHQSLAGLCDRVTLVAAGLPLTLKAV